MFDRSLLLPWTGPLPVTYWCWARRVSLMLTGVLDAGCCSCKHSNIGPQWREWQVGVFACAVCACKVKPPQPERGSSRGGFTEERRVSSITCNEAYCRGKKAPEHMLCRPCLLGAQIRVCVVCVFVCAAVVASAGRCVGWRCCSKGLQVPAVVAKRSGGCASGCSLRVSERWTSGVHLCTGLRDGLLVVWIVRGAVCASVAIDLVSLVCLTAFFNTPDRR